THRTKGRRRLFFEYLALQDLQSAPWDRQVLYDVFDLYARVYKCDSAPEQKRAFWVEFTNQLFERAGVAGRTARQADRHSDAIRAIFGSECFELYADVQPVLSAFKQQGLKLAVISNWHRGLDTFCEELNLSGVLDAVISSADVGFEKPDACIFEE